MNNSLSPQSVPAPMPHPASDLGTCVQGIRHSILDWSENHPILGRVADPVTARILALLQLLIDLIARFAAGEFAPQRQGTQHPAHHAVAPHAMAPRRPARAVPRLRPIPGTARPPCDLRAPCAAAATRAPHGHSVAPPFPAVPSVDFPTRPHTRARPPPRAKIGVPNPTAGARPIC